MINERLKKQLEFILEIDRLKHIFRQNYLSDGSRNENDAEHSWHIAVMAMLLSEHISAENIDILKVIKMVLIHDLVEIDAGDTYCYDEKAGMDKAEREQKAADRLFGILPEDQTQEFMELWEEFEKQSTPESRFAAVLDRLQPLMLNYNSEGKSWKKHNISADKVLKRNEMVQDASPEIWDYIEGIISEAKKAGYLL
ncbi:MAG: HD domain-containing protein [Clostridia bacterium]|nr:HD domain-containing protein [Clostridia bacterium]